MLLHLILAIPTKIQYMYIFEIYMSMKTEADKMITDERK